MTTGAPTQNMPKGTFFLRYATVPTQSLPRVGQKTVRQFDLL